ncbi:MAG: ribonuclease VapC48 [Gemmatimonadales bacterium]|nr:MAG: ribonuclease VapC48 [Gemmatimonadales bacterium]
MRAVDTNVLIYAEVVSSRHHARAREVLQDLAEGGAAWAIPWPCIYEFLRVVTHPRVFYPPVPVELALEDLEEILASPSLLLLSETSRHGEVMSRVVRDAGVSGNLIHDAHIVALCLEHGVSELLTGDRDFSRFKGIKVVDPFAT